VPSTIQSSTKTEEISATSAAGRAWNRVRSTFASDVTEDSVTHDQENTRSRHRYRRAAMNGVTSLLAKLVVLATTLITVPLTYRYLGTERYGLWMTITSVVLFLGFADFGVGNGVTASIAKADGTDSREAAQRSVSCGFYLLTMIAVCLVLVFAAFYQFIPWPHLFGTKTALASQEAGPASAVLLLCTALNMPLGIVLRIQLGYQEGYIGDLWNAAGNLLALFVIFLVVHLKGNLPMLVCAVAGAPLLATAINGILQFFYVRPWIRPRFSLFESKAALQLASVGGLFFLQQCFGLIYYVTDNIVISREMGAAQVAHYAVLQRIFSIGLVAQYFMMPLWPAIAEAVVRRDYAWARRTARRAILFSLVTGAICGTVLLLISGFVMKRWSGVDLGPIDALRIGFAVWVVMVGFIAAMNAILNQPGTMPKHLVLFGSASIASLILKFVFASRGSLTGVIWSTTIAFGIIYVIPAIRLAFNSLSDVEEVL
jgi:O-antigen/teichoic acid export membrane protein